MSVYIPDTFDFSLTYYISGGMQGYPENNFPLFAHVEETLEAAQVKVVSPHLIPHNVDRPEGYIWKDFLRTDVYWMTKKCNGLILLRGWPQSQGAGMEANVAHRLGYPTYFYADSGDPDSEDVLIDMNRRD